MKSYPTLTIVYNRLKYQSKSGFAPVYLRIYYKAKTDYAILSRIPPIHQQDWIGNTKQDLYVLNEDVNRAIKEILHSSKDWVQGKVLNGHPITIEEIKEQVVGVKANETFNEFVDRYIRNINKRKSESEKFEFGTIKVYKTYKRHLNDFRESIQFNELSPTLAHEFERFLAVDRNLNGASRNKYFDKFKITYRAAFKEGLVKIDEKLMFDGIKIKEEKSRRVALNQAEMKTLLESTLKDPRDEFFKSIFAFQCLTGMYYSDIRELKVSNIQREIFKENEIEKTIDYITSNRIKNDQSYVIPLFESTKEILDKHSTWKSGDPERLLFEELISDQKYNQKLKSIADQLSIKKNITNKVGRHTFSELMASLGVPLKTVGSALGHTQVSTTEIYARMSTSSALRGWIDFKL
ncbi:MAG: site-specific integrase [Ekhidna sp.]|nr:site-specific integrase [Ekhidna sp.]